MTITGDQLYEQRMADWTAKYGPEEIARIEHIIRDESYNPAILLSHNTTACPSWCDKSHHTGNVDDTPRVIHRPAPPQLIDHAIYDNGSNPHPKGPGFEVVLEAIEYVASPGRLHYVLDIVGDSDGLHSVDGEPWFFALPVSYLEVLAAALPRIRQMIAEA